MTVPQLANRFLSTTLVLLAAIFYFGYLWQGALNVPFADDIFDVLKVLSDLLGAEDPATAWEILYTQHNDHRTLSSRLLYFAVYLVSGEIDFRVLIFLANLALPLLLYSLYRVAHQHRLNYLVIVPAALALFQPRAYGVMLWSMAAFAYFYVFLYGFYSLHCLYNVTRLRFAAATVLALLATFTLASGQLVWLVGLASLLHQYFREKRISYWYPLCWLVFAVAACSFWRLGLNTPNTPMAMLESVLASPGYYVLYALTLLGNGVTEKSVALAASTGAVMLITLLVLSLRSRKQPDLRLELCCWYVVLSVIAMTMGRAPYSTIEYALSSRYSFPSIIALSTLWVLIVLRTNVRSHGIMLIAILVSGAYCISAYGIYSEALQPHLDKRVDDFNRGRYWAWPHPNRETKAIVEKAVTMGLYTPPVTPLPRIQSAL